MRAHCFSQTCRVANIISEAILLAGVQASQPVIFLHNDRMGLLPQGTRKRGFPSSDFTAHKVQGWLFPRHISKNLRGCMQHH